ncbi:MAG: hypothetical protein ACE5D2_04585 [Fidelibacterota bacterium]
MNHFLKQLLLTALTTVFLWYPLTGQTTASHVGVFIHENMINAFLQSIGPVSGNGQKKKTHYQWTVMDPRVDIEPGQATFLAKVHIKAGAFEANKQARGNVDIQYLPEENKIKITVKEARVKLYFKLLGKKIPIGTINVADYYRPSFEFPGPQPIQKTIDVDLPDGTKKTIQLISRDENLVIEKDRISVYSNLEFTPQG